MKLRELFWGRKKRAGTDEEPPDETEETEEERKRREEEERKRREKGLYKGYFGEGVRRGRMLKRIEEDED
ncbi:MAG: hypothetical protein WHT06_15935 [Desulfobacterales bacterium]